jgi:hypothetical protein
MRIRHRVPSIFSLSMVDMLCCALGCVILLWLLNAKQHEDDAAEQERTSAALLAEARAERDRERGLLGSVQADRDRQSSLLAEARAGLAGSRVALASLKGQIRTLEEGREELRRQLAAQQQQARDLEGKLKRSAARVATLEAEVRAGSDRLSKVRAQASDLDSRAARERARADGLAARLMQAESRLRALNADLEQARRSHAAEQERALALQQEVLRRRKELQALGRNLAELRSARSALEREIDARYRDLAQARPYRERWASAEGRVQALEKQLRERQQALAEAEGEKRVLAARERRARAAAENRFAGIALTGKRVIFLVDVSGSMEMVDEKTPAPDKWVEVRNTVARLMRSLPDLEKFQVITFSTSPSYPLGGPGKWLDYDGRSAEATLKALGALKPKGGTNMYAALEAAFRYRAEGLDTIYLLSDGLPNIGPGLTARDRKNLTEAQRGHKLGKHIRATLRKNWNRLLGKRRPRVRINTIGFFYESPDLGSFLWALAREHDGSFVGMSRP